MVEAGKEKEEWRYSTRVTGELFVMMTGIGMMLTSFVANWDFLMLLEAVRFGWTMWDVPEVKVQLQIVRTEDGA